MKEILKTALMWAMIICLVPVLLSARNSAADTGKELPDNPENGADEPRSSFDLGADPVLTVCSPEGSVSEMPLEEYVWRALLAEIPGDMDGGAMKAQAAAARTYAVRRILSGKDTAASGISAHIFADPEKYQIWLTDSEISALFDSSDVIVQKARAAAAQTAGEIIVYNGSPIIAAFHTANGGMTESSENVWGTPEPYLVPVDSTWDKASNYNGRERIFTDRETAARISAEYSEYNGDTKAEILSVTPSGTVMEMRLGGVTLTGRHFAEMFSLDSAAFTLSHSDGEITVITNGSGHMAGMSMCGADGMAREGADYREILAHYYPGTAVGMIEARAIRGK